MCMYCRHPPMLHNTTQHNTTTTTQHQVQMRRCPKPVIAMVAGYAVGGGHILHMICDLTIAADNAVFGQTGPRVGSFDAGYGSSHMARLVGQKKVCTRGSIDQSWTLMMIDV